jgi:DNA-binding transcriptional LysR family regulator
VSLSSLDLNLLLVLDTVLRERSVAKAAQRLHVTPSAVSNSLAKLRAALGDPLVTRRGRGIVPTPRAAELAPALKRALTELETALAQGPFQAASCTRTFTLALADALQIAWLPGIAAALSKSMPLAHLRVIGIDSLLSLGDLASSDVDLHVGVRATGPGIHAEALYDEPTLLVTRRNHQGATVKLSRPQLAALRHVAVELAPGRGFRDPVAAAYTRARIERQVAMTVPSFAAAAAVVATTSLVTTLPRSLFVVQGARWGLRAVKGPAVPNHTIPIALCWHERTHADPASAAFRALIAAAIRAGAGAFAGSPSPRSARLPP